MVLATHFVRKFDRVGLEHGIKLGKVKFGGFVGGDCAHLLERCFGLGLVSAGDGDVCAQLCKVDGDCPLASGWSGTRTARADALCAAGDEDVFAAEIVLDIVGVEIVVAAHRLDVRGTTGRDGNKSVISSNHFV